MNKRVKTNWEERGYKVVDPRTLKGKISLIEIQLITALIRPCPPGASFQAHREAEASALADYKKVIVTALDARNHRARGWLIAHHPQNEVTNARRAEYMVDAWIAVTRAKQGLNDGDDDVVRRHIATAQHCLEQAEEDFLTHEVGETRARVAKSGGEGTRRDAVRGKFIRLLAEKKPKQGWDSQANAAKKIAPLLITFIEKRPSTEMKTENLEKQLLRWLGKKDSEERRAYEASRRV